MLRDGPILFDAADRSAYIPRPHVEDRLHQAVRSGHGILLVGPAGSGKTTLLNWLRHRLREAGEPVVRVDAAMAADAGTVLELIEQALHSQHPTAKTLYRPSGLPAGSSEILVLQEHVQRIAAAPATTVLLDNLTERKAVKALFGGLRDLLWETPHRWVVAARPQDRPTFLSPPADAFFADRITIPPLSAAEINEFVRRQPDAGARHHQELRDIELVYPREAVQWLLHPDAAPPSVTDAQEQLGEMPAFVLGEVVARNSAVGADDPELVQRTGLSPVTLRKHLGLLHRAGFLDRIEERDGSPGRPRTMYLPAEGHGR